MVERNRIKLLKDAEPNPKGRYVQYWMQQAMRAEGNAALDHAIELANGLKLPVAVSFGLTGSKSPPYPDANARHYTFLLEGLAEVEATLKARGIAFAIRRGAPDEVTAEIARDAAVLVCDRGYLKPQRRWQEAVVKAVETRIVQVETDAVVPIDTVSGKHEFAARTIRPKITRLWEDYLVEAPSPRLGRRSTGLELQSDVDLSDIGKVVASLKIDREVGPVRRFQGGLKAARALLRAFIAKGLDGYRETRSAPEQEAVSHLSPYFHFGQISPVEVALAVRGSGKGSKADRDAYLEELIVRRELAFNHCFHEPHYDGFEGLPAWAKEALGKHAHDKRPHHYSRAKLEAGETHDEAWNAAMREMRETGYMHNRMRMYWGKKIIEWSRTPEEAFRTALAINNKYFVDGRDANSFTNIGWLFGLHDRPWVRRPVFGTIRYMGNATLKKFDLKAYIASVDKLAAAEAAG